MQQRSCPFKRSSRRVPPHCSLRQDNDVSLTSHNAERNSDGGCSTRREFLLSADSVWRNSPSPVLLTHSLVHPKWFQLCLGLVIFFSGWGGIDEIYIVFI